MNQRAFDIPIARTLQVVGQIHAKLRPTACKRKAPDLVGQAANDFLHQQLLLPQSEGLMACKFGTYELKAFVNFFGREIGLRKKDVSHLLHYHYRLFRNENHTLQHLCNNAGFFPKEKELAHRYAQLVAEDWPLVDILCSYQKEEAYLFSLTTNQKVKRLDLDGYYSPFFWKNPWTSALRGKRILVISPFAASIKKQYERRTELFDDPETLPEFAELHTLKAVQSIAGNKPPFPDWFEALNSMKEAMNHVDYDIALIGCGAYGYHLAAHAKRQGRIGLHLGGAVQMLFGIYGKRWKDDSRFAPYIKKSWIRPSSEETPHNAETIEGGCYW